MLKFAVKRFYPTISTCKRVCICVCIYVTTVCIGSTMTVYSVLGYCDIGMGCSWHGVVSSCPGDVGIWTIYLQSTVVSFILILVTWSREEKFVLVVSTCFKCFFQLVRGELVVCTCCMLSG